jgi:TonB-linked SusC/RagA family outer membrane protein
MKQAILKSAALIASLLLLGITAFAQNRPVSGRVVDKNGEPVVGAAVVVVGNNALGTETNLDGNFSLMVPPQATLSVSCIGYATQTVAIAGRPVVNITLEEDNEFLEETVVIGYGVQKKSDLSGAVASVSSEELKNRSTVDAAAALQGKAAGVHVLTNGAPGEGATIRVRGYSSNGGSLSPLYIVDGLQVSSIQYIDPSMIESIEVLKDAASAAIYGAQAGNGVVLVTTKTGKDGQVSVTYNGKATLQTFHKRPMMNREELIRYLGYEYGSDWVKGQMDQFDYKHSDYPNGVIDTDWIDAFTEPTWSHQHGISFSGGNKNGHFFTALNYVYDDGIVKGKKDVYNRLTAQVNADYNLFKWLQVGSNNSIEKWSTQSVSQRGYGSSFEQMLVMDPMTPVYWLTPEEMTLSFKTVYDALQNGTSDINYTLFRDDHGWYANTKYSDMEGSALAKRDSSKGSNGGFNINGTFFANVMPLKGLTITSRLGYRLNFSTSHSYSTPYWIGDRGSSKTYSISASASTGWYYQWENYFNYLFNIGKNNFTVMAGMSYRESNSDGVSASSSGADILQKYEENYQYISYLLDDAPKTMSNAPSKSASLAYYGRLIWNYDNRYQLQANFRADAFDSSKLPANSRWGYFPSISAYWTISNERFFKDNVNTDIFNFLKFRASWGRNGNISVLSGYPYTATVSKSGSYQYHVDQVGSVDGYAPSKLPNPNLKWETSEQLDFGLNARMFNNRLTFDMDYYNKQTKDLLFSVSIPSELGFSSVTTNGGNVLNRGWEFELGWRDRIGEVNYSISGNFTTLHNEVLSLAEGSTPSRRTDASSSNYQVETVFDVGYPIWYMNGYVYEGVASDGSPIIKDVDGSGEINSGDLTYIGTTTPKYTFGLNFTLDWKGFDFALYGSGVSGNVLMPVLHRTGFKNDLRYYLTEYEAGRWPDPSKIYGDYKFWSSTANVFKGDYFRIKQMQFGYTLPSRITKKAAISNLRFYVSLDDYFTFSKYPGLDPETATMNNSTGAGLDFGSYPTMQKILLGVNITF